MKNMVERLKENQIREWADLIHHPFVLSLGQGTATHAQFGYFLTQDALYLGDFLKTLATGAARAPRRRWAEILLKHSLNAMTAETELHAALLPACGVSSAVLNAAVMGPVTVAYTDHLIRTALDRNWSGLIAAALPCYLSYQEIGEMLQTQYHSTDPLYRQWIANYAGDEYSEAVREFLSIVNELDPGAGEFKQMVQVFQRSVFYEYLFWSQASNLGHAVLT